MKTNYQQEILKELKKINNKIDIVLMAKMKDAPKNELSFQEILDSTGRTQFTNKDVVDSISPHQTQDIEFFNVERYVSDDELEEEYSKRNLIPAHPYSLALYSKENQDIVDSKKYVATHWKDSSGKWCYAAFGQWCGGERRVSVDRDYDAWLDYWWFAGLRK